MPYPAQTPACRPPTGIRHQCQRCFQAWIRDAIATDADHPERLVAIDGKTCRRSHDRAKDLGALHIVSAWASEEGIARGQVGTGARSNEITAIPQLLGQIDLAGTLITIDAMGCQKEIVEQVVTGGGDCVIAVKDNQPKLLAAIQTHFLDHLERDLEELRYRYHVTRDDGHGRIDERSYYLTKVPRDFAPAKDWPWVKAIGYSVRITRHADGTESDEVRYYLSSRYLSGKRFGEAVRDHWSIETMHWMLDVLTRQERYSCYVQLWHCSILDVLVLEVAGNSCRELRQSLHEPPQFPSQFLAILRQ